MADMVAVDGAVRSRAWLASKLGISRGAVAQWKKVPANRVGEVAKLTGLTPQQIRPDIFGLEAAA